ncbi:hypothetical protein HPP92_013753 [Vanilla planifolia]|uniref:Uncharacterized protein n=1 Tax=Vanilla planifolia TaxID=51239 RepID=A0A835QYC7_VANPL|nr:hypothetical protein HPP92_013753 [Vanilla planifolia]
MARKGGTAVFFWATLLLWSVLVVFEVFFNQRKELSMVCAGFAFFQAANWVLRRGVSRDPLFVNTAVSLLHSLLFDVKDIVQPSNHPENGLGRTSVRILILFKISSD